MPAVPPLKCCQKLGHGLTFGSSTVVTVLDAASPSSAPNEVTASTVNVSDQVMKGRVFVLGRLDTGNLFYSVTDAAGMNVT